MAVLTTDNTGSLVTGTSGNIKWVKVKLLNRMMMKEVGEEVARERQIGEILVIPKPFAMELLQINRVELVEQTQTTEGASK